MARRRKHAITRKHEITNVAVAALETEIGQLMSDLETRLDRLNGLAKTSTAKASGEINAFVNSTVGHLTDQVTGTLRTGTRSNEAIDLGSDALKKVADQIEQRPLLTLAIAAGIGFVAGLARRN